MAGSEDQRKGNDQGAEETEATEAEAERKVTIDDELSEAFDKAFGEAEGESTRSRVARLTRRLMERGSDETRNILGTVLDGSDRAKNEMVRMFAREVRHYLEALRIKEDVMELARSHSLEVHASFSLKPLTAESGEETEEKEPTEEESD
ncbi:MAG: hypothetical protein JRI25_21865 [Deltaproteobacteria bacterium]|nr:hypothetical protein [Deltaproteobacteria bacterium]